MASSALADPTAVLLHLFISSDNLDLFPTQVSDHFHRVFSANHALDQIPSLHVNNPPEAQKDRSLVQFNAMIQDTSLSNEIYSAGPTCGGWGLPSNVASSDNIDCANLRECAVFWAVSIPGQTKWCSDVANETSHLSSSCRTSHPHKFPIPGAPHIGVQVKIYNLRDAQSLRSTDLFTFVGILTSELLHADIDLPAPTMVPTLHVLFLQRIPPTIVPRSYPYLPRNSTSISELRAELIAWIADEALAGDQLAAEWILLGIVARLYSRSPPMLPPSLTISNFPPPTTNASAVPSLVHVLSHIVPTLSMLPLSLSVLNTNTFAPELKDETLTSGWLQLPKGSICVISEAGVTEGAVSEKGISNLRAVQDMMNVQTLEYIFPYSRFAFDTDINIFTLSQGRKSTFFQTNINIPLQLTTNQSLYKSPDQTLLPVQGKLEMFRNFVGSAKVGNVSITDETAEYIRDDFVNERRAATLCKLEVGSNHFTSNDLIQRMMVARLLALSLQEHEISICIWERVKELETMRKARMQ